MTKIGDVKLVLKQFSFFFETKFEKIADFGLSQVRRGKEKKMDEDEAPGSVLFMAPEVRYFFFGVFFNLNFRFF